MGFKYTDFTPIDDRILVQPGLAFKYKVVQTELEEVKRPNTTLGKNKKDYLLDAKEAKPIQKEAELTSKLRIGKVLSVGTSLNPNTVLPFEIGDWIVYEVARGAMFELLYEGDPDTCPVLLPRYNVISKASEESINNFIKQIDETNKEKSSEGTEKSSN